MKGTGLRYVAVDHQGNQSSSPEEADRLADEVCEAIKILTADRGSHAYAAQWTMQREVGRHLGVDGERQKRFGIDR
jgi:hypothetical protein